MTTPWPNLKCVWLDLTAAHSHAGRRSRSRIDTNARHARATQLVELIADALAFTRRLAMMVEGHLRANHRRQP